MKKGGTLALLFLFVGNGVARMMEKDSACGIKDVDCIASDSGSAYTGTVSKTKAGVECQAWNDQSPHQHDVGTEMEHNHCRNPDGKPGLWCYTKDSNTSWDFCEVKICRECESDLDFEDSDGEKDIVKLKGRCTVKKTAKTVLTGIQTKAECLTACLANKAATGCQYRRVKKICKVVTALFKKASYRLGVTCWRFDDVVKHAGDVAVFSNVTKTRRVWHHCGGGWHCPHHSHHCCEEKYDSPPVSCCSSQFPACGNTGDGVCWVTENHVPGAPDFLGTPKFKKKHLNSDISTRDQAIDMCNMRPAYINENTIYPGPLGNTDDINVKTGIISQRIKGDRWKCSKTSDWDCAPQLLEEGYEWLVKYHTRTGHYFWEQTTQVPIE